MDMSGNVDLNSLVIQSENGEEIAYHVVSVKEDDGGHYILSSDQNEAISEDGVTTVYVTDGDVPIKIEPQDSVEECVATSDIAQTQVTSMYGRPIAVPIDSVHMSANTGDVKIQRITLDGAQVDGIDMPNEDSEMIIETTDEYGNVYYIHQVGVPVEHSPAESPPAVVKKPTPASAPIWKQKHNMIGNKMVIPNQCKVNYPEFTRTTGSRRRLIIDSSKSISVREFKAQLNDTSDILNTMDLAPANKKMLRYLKTGGVGQLFAYPGRPIPVRKLFTRLYQRHLTSKTQPPEPTEGDQLELMPLGFQPEGFANSQHGDGTVTDSVERISVDASKIKRITRKRKYPEAEEYNRKALQEQVQTNFKNLIAESQKNMETVLDSSVVVDDHSNLRILVEAAENDNSNEHNSQAIRVYPGRQRKGAKEAESLSDTKIIVIDEEGREVQGLNPLHQNIEVLLAAAAESTSEGLEQVFICDSDGTYKAQNIKTLLTEEGQQIIIMEDTLEDSKHTIAVTS